MKLLKNRKIKISVLLILTFIISAIFSFTYAFEILYEVIPIDSNTQDTAFIYRKQVAASKSRVR